MVWATSRDRLVIDNLQYALDRENLRDVGLALGAAVSAAAHPAISDPRNCTVPLRELRLLSVRGFRRLIAGAACLTCALALADGVQKLETVEVTGHYDNSVGSTDAASAGVITPQLDRRPPLLRPGEVLEYVPGMIVTQHSGDGKANQYFLRGFNLDHGTDFATYVAGMPVNMPTHAHGQGYTDLNFMIPELVDAHRLPQGTVLRRRGRLRHRPARRQHQLLRHA